MSIEEIVRAWKADEQDQQDQHIPENPAGYELSDEELEQVVGGDCDPDYTDIACLPFGTPITTCPQGGTA